MNKPPDPRPPAPYPVNPRIWLEWNSMGTPKEWQPYQPEHPDAYRDGLLKQARNHNPRPASSAAPEPTR